MKLLPLVAILAILGSIDAFADTPYAMLLAQFSASPSATVNDLKWYYGTCFFSNEADTPISVQFATLVGTDETGAPKQEPALWDEGYFDFFNPLYGYQMGPFGDYTRSLNLPFDQSPGISVVNGMLQKHVSDNSIVEYHRTDTDLLVFVNSDPAALHPNVVCDFPFQSKMYAASGGEHTMTLNTDPEVLNQAGDQVLQYNLVNFSHKNDLATFTVNVSVTGDDASNFKVLGDAIGHNPNVIRSPLKANSFGNWQVKIHSNEPGKHGVLVFDVAQKGANVMHYEQAF